VNGSPAAGPIRGGGKGKREEGTTAGRKCPRQERNLSFIMVIVTSFKKNSEVALSRL
jgi:hypothetical protein